MLMLKYFKYYLFGGEIVFKKPRLHKTGFLYDRKLGHNILKRLWLELLIFKRRIKTKSTRSKLPGA
jgi:hypothetical protein